MADDLDLESALYHPLPPGPYMRTLSLEQSSTTGERQYSLQHRCINAEEPYLALSYRWQKSETQPTIFVNSRIFGVMQTVKDFLDLHMGNQICNEIFIDSICINQQDLEERASQVRLMGRIYALAAKVCIWLGREISAKERPVLRTVLEWSKDGLLPQEDRYEFVAVAFIKEYWKRAWIIQEIALAREIELFWGETILSETMLHRAGNRLGLMVMNPDLIRPTEVLEQRRDSSSGTLSSSLVQLLCAYEHTQATDVRDKVYAMLSLAGDTTGTQGSLTVEYGPTKSPVDVFCDVMAHCDIKPGHCFFIANRVARSLGADVEDMRASLRALRQTTCARGWIVGVVQGNSEDSTSPQLHKGLLGRDTPRLRDFQRDLKIIASSAENVRKPSESRMQTDNAIISPVGKHHDQPSTPAWRLYSASDLVLKDHKDAHVLSKELLKAGDVIVNFAQTSIILVLRKAFGDSYLPISGAQSSLGWRINPLYPDVSPTWAWVDDEPDVRGFAGVIFRVNLLAIIEIATSGTEIFQGTTPLVDQGL